MAGRSASAASKGLSYRSAPARCIADAESFQKEMREGLGKSGYVENQNLLFELRSAEGKLDPLPGLAAELVALKVDVIVALLTPCALAAQKATRQIPVKVPESFLLRADQVIE